MTPISSYQSLVAKNPLLHVVAEVAQAAGMETYVVGGFVRDVILGRPLKDIDFVTLGSGMDLARLVADQLGIRHIVTYPNFGTAMVPHGDHMLEFVGARKEKYFDRGTRRPQVAAGTLEEDLSRRDFTINAMAISLNAGSAGELLDPFDGRTDLANGIIRTPLDPETTFDDDPLRILRAIRFATQLSYAITPEALTAIGKVKDRLSIISQERITDEFLKILSSPKPSIGFTLMHETGVLPVLHPELAPMVGVEQLDGYGHKDTFFHTLQVLDNICMATDNVYLRLSALWHDVGKPRTKRFVKGRGWTFHGHDDLGARMIPGLFKKFRLPMTQMKYVEKLVRLHLRPIALVKDHITDSAVRRVLFEAGEDIDDLMKLCYADVTTKSYARKDRYWKNYDRVLKKMADVEEKDRLRKWEPPVSGTDIMEICGLSPSPLVGRFKTGIEEAILEGRIPNDRDAALELLKTFRAEWEAGRLFSEAETNRH